MLFKLAVRNVRRQASSYLIYFITVMLTVAFLFALNNMIFGEVLGNTHVLYEDIVRPLLAALSVVLAAIMAFVLAYATAFLLRRRKKEFGLYLTLGLSRGNILALFAGETAITFLASLAAGMLLGLGLFRGLLYALLRFIDRADVSGGYSLGGTVWTVALVAAVFLLSALASLGYLRFAKISALLAGESRTEKAVRFPWLWPVLAAAALAAGVLACVGFVGRIAYQYSAETTIYLREDQKRNGLGKRLYQALEEISRLQNLTNLYACIGYPETEDEYLTKNSAQFHAHMGYRMVGEFRQCGYKFGRWYHMVWMEKRLAEAAEPPLPLIPFAELSGKAS